MHQFKMEICIVSIHFKSLHSNPVLMKITVLHLHHPTFSGGVAPLPVGSCGGEGRDRRPRGDSVLMDSPGDRLQLLSSSHDSSETFGSCVSAVEGEGAGGWIGRRQTGALHPIQSICSCVSTNSQACGDPAFTGVEPGDFSALFKRAELTLSERS